MKKIVYLPKALLEIASIFFTILAVIVAGLFSFFLERLRILLLKIAFKDLDKENKKFYMHDYNYRYDVHFNLNGKFVTKIIPTSMIRLPKFINDLKEELGFVNCKKFSNHLQSYNGLSYIKTNSSIFFYPFKKNKRFLESIHNFDMQNLSKEEIDNIMNLDISDSQKYIIMKKYSGQTI